MSTLAKIFSLVYNIFNARGEYYMINEGKRNVQLYPFYKMVGYDYVFYSVISFLFLTITKGFSVSQIMFLSGFSAIFMSVLQIPTNYIVEKIGLKKGMVIGNLLWITHCFIYIVSNDFIFFIIAELICSFGSCFKCLSETQLLYASLKKIGKKSSYSKIEGSGVALYFYLEALSALIVGYLFNINQYLPIYITFTILIISFVISIFFIDVEDKKSEEEITNPKDYIKGLKLILKSNRVISIFLYTFVISGIIAVGITLQKSLLIELNIGTIKYTIILAVFTLFLGIGSKIQFLIENITKRKNLTFIGYSIITIIGLVGLINVIFSDSSNLIYVTIVMLALFNLLQGTYRISIKKYLNNFTTSEIRGKILSVFYIFENVGKSSFLFISGIILDAAGTRQTCIIVAVSVAIMLYFILKFMKKKLGLNPEEYSKKEIFGMDVSED
jgi:hypothetical protein